MEMVLLIFCLTSVIITSVIVAVELRGEKTLSKQSFKGEINDNSFYGRKILAQDIKTNEQLRNRVFETLNHQLNKLGYDSKEPKLRFINDTLNSDYNELTELSSNELQAAFSAIIHARESNEIAA